MLKLKLHSLKYQRYLKSKKWKQLSIQCRAATNNKCCICLAPSAETHHASYKNLGKEKIGEDIFGVCLLCHKALHNKFLWVNKNEREKMHLFLKKRFQQITSKVTN